MSEMLGNEPVSTHDTGRTCDCVTRHVPRATHVHRHHILPLAWGGDDSEGNIVWLCPSSHEHVHILLRAYRREGKEPSWSFRRQFNPYVRRVAESGWMRYIQHLDRTTI